MQDDISKIKTCYQCHISKDIDNFYTHYIKRSNYLCKYCHIENNKKYYIRNKEHMKLLYRRWRYNNLDKSRSYHRKYIKNKRKNNLTNRFRHYVSRTIRHILKLNNGYKNSSTWNKLPYSPQQLKSHLESLWQPWMNWSNYGNKKGCWDIDHIIPQSKLPYDSLDHPNFLKCWQLSNLRPLEAIRNLLKGNK